MPTAPPKEIEQPKVTKDKCKNFHKLLHPSHRDSDYSMFSFSDKDPSTSEVKALAGSGDQFVAPKGKNVFFHILCK